MIEFELSFSKQALKLMMATSVSEKEIIAFVSKKKYVIGGGDIVAFIESRED